MENLFSSISKTALTLAVCLAAASLVGVAQAKEKAVGDKVQLAGHWTYNAKQSDDSDRKVHEAQIANETGVNESHGGGANPTAGTTPGGGIGDGIGGGYPTVGGMGGGRMGAGGMGGLGGMGGGQSGRQGTRGLEVSSEEWERMAANPRYVQIDQQSGQIQVSNDLDEPQTFYLDGKKHESKNASGKKISTKGTWEGDNFIAETKLGRAQRITESYHLIDDGKRLEVIMRFEDSAFNSPLVIRRVYDAGKAPAH
jgi:hypothetical protein